MTWDTIMAGLAEDVIDAFGVSITYRARSAGTYTASTGKTAATTTDTTISASRSRSRVDLANEDKTRTDVVVYTIRASDLASEPDANDQIIDGSSTRFIYRVEKSVDGKMREVYTQTRVG